LGRIATIFPVQHRNSGAPLELVGVSMVVDRMAGEIVLLIFRVITTVMVMFMAMGVEANAVKTECSRSSSRNVRQILKNVNILFLLWFDLTCFVFFCDRNSLRN
jgi:hypothetical protein